jgi:hypothetical protein
MNVTAGGALALCRRAKIPAPTRGLPGPAGRDGPRSRLASRQPVGVRAFAARRRAAAVDVIGRWIPGCAEGNRIRSVLTPPQLARLARLAQLQRAEDHFRRRSDSPNGRAPATVNRYLSALRPRWNWGRAAQYIPAARTGACCLDRWRTRSSMERAAASMASATRGVAIDKRRM